MEGNYNFCKIIIEEMKKLGFKDSSIEQIKSNQLFMDSYERESKFQRAMLSTLFFRIFMNGKHKVPSQIRLALNIAPDSVGWLDDVKLVILPFLKENEDIFFPTIN